MSFKDTRYGADCPICGDYLPGSDDARMVWSGIVMAAKADQVGNCDLCGEECESVQRTKEIAAAGIPDTGLPLTNDEPWGSYP